MRRFVFFQSDENPRHGQLVIVGKESKHGGGMNVE